MEQIISGDNITAMGEWQQILRNNINAIGEWQQIDIHMINAMGNGNISLGE